MKKPLCHEARSQKGATLVEFIVVFPTMLMMLLGVAQTALVFHAKSNLNYATFEGARAGSVDHAKTSSIVKGFQKAMIGYYGGGTSNSQLASSLAKVIGDMAPSTDLPSGSVRIEILSPTKESFIDYASPATASKLGVSGKVIPNTNLSFLTCPGDNPGCASDPKTNQSGQTLADANLLKIRITYGIPQAKQVPFVGRFYTWAISKTNPTDTDLFRRALVAAGRIPVVTHATVRMQSAAIENTLMVSTPGAGNNGEPKDSGIPPLALLPQCSTMDPTCMSGELPDEEPIDTGSGPTDPGGGGSDTGTCSAP
jgi:hypothetical protein